MNKTLSVTELNRYIKAIIDRDEILSKVTILGELSNFTNHQKTGHMYMTVKDESSAIKAVMFSRDAQKLKFCPESGMKVILTGRIAVFERDGQYQLYISSMQPDGVGDLHLAFEQLKEKLGAEGLFDTAYKKPLPKTPTKIGVVTAATGAAVQDIINVLGRRFPYAKVIVYPVLVQGENAPPDIVSAIEYFNRENHVNVMIVGRGGGSIEDLWAFNDERVARAIFASEIPIISAVGHETDFTIADFVADLRAPTPSAAAELAVPDIITLKQRFLNVNERMLGILKKRINNSREKLKGYSERRVLTNPRNYIDDRKMALASLSKSLYSAFDSKLSKKRLLLSGTAAKLDALSPLGVLSRGYAIAKTERGEVKSIKDVKVGENIELRLTDGLILTEVKEKKNAKKDS